jgi:hypothetical protein
MPGSIELGNLYDSFYYRHCCGKDYQRTDEWLAFFKNIAQQISRQLAPKTALDAGCAMGFLVSRPEEIKFINQTPAIIF